MEFITEWPPPPRELNSEEEPKVKKMRKVKSAQGVIEDLVSAQALIASWWRKKASNENQRQLLNNVKSQAPLARIKAICQLEQSQAFLKDLENRLVKDSTVTDTYTLLTLYRILEKDQEAFSSSQRLLEMRGLDFLSGSDALANLEYIKELSLFDKEILRVATLAQLQYLSTRCPNKF